MGIVFAIKNKKIKIMSFGETLSLLALLVALSKYLIERISKEKRVSFEEAENVLIECIKDGIKTLI